MALRIAVFAATGKDILTVILARIPTTTLFATTAIAATDALSIGSLFASRMRPLPI